MGQAGITDRNGNGHSFRVLIDGIERKGKAMNRFYVEIWRAGADAPETYHCVTMRLAWATMRRAMRNGAESVMLGEGAALWFCVE